METCAFLKERSRGPRRVLDSVTPISPEHVVERVEALVCIHDMDGRIVFVNPATCHFLGYSSEEMVGKSFANFLDGRVKKSAAAYLERMRNSVRDEGIMRLRSKSGEPRLCFYRNVIQDGLVIGSAMDLGGVVATRRHSARERHRHALVFDHIWDAIVLTDLAGNILDWNAAAERIFGYLREDVIGKNVSFLDPADLSETVASRIVAGLEANNRWRGEIPFVRSDGSQGIRELAVLPVRDERGEHIANIGVNRDITERRQSEERLRRSEEMFRLVIENSSDVVLICDPSGEIDFANAAIEQVLGHRPGTFADVVEPEDLPELERLLSGRARTSLRCRDAAGSWRVLDCVSAPFRDSSGALRVLVDGRDVSENTRVQAELRQSEQRYRSLFELNMAGVVRTRPDGTILECNQAFARMLGYERNDLEGSDITDLYVEAEDRRKFLQAVRENGAVTNYEFCYRHKHGRKVWLLGNSTLVGSPETGPLIGNVVDITERRNLEEQLRQSQKMEAIGRLAGGVAHDFNNLLTVIAGHCEIAHESLETDDPLRWSMSEIKRATERASALTNQLLAFSRRQVVQPSILNLNEIVLDMQNMLRRVIGEDVELIVRQEPELGRIKADLTQIEQLILNLAINARDAMPNGGRLIIETVNAGSDGKGTSYIALRVTDTGCGMDSQTKTRIFEPFFTTKTTGKGTGLGLSTVYGTVSQSGGHIDVSSELGKGSTFLVYFPRSEAVETSRENPVAITDLRGTETILVAEDEVMVRQMVSEILTRLGYHIVTAEDGQAALSLARARKEPVDLVLTDVVMPRLGGRQLVDELQTLWPGTKFVYMSGYTDDAILHHGVHEHTVAFLQKPFTPEALARKVRAVLDLV